MAFPIRCHCGAVEATLDSPQRGVRAICYCRDCRAYAHHLGHPERTLDRCGGTDIVATRPDFLQFTQGFEWVRCVSLSDKGLLRWYAGCCRTPIGNTPRDAKMPYVGLVAACLAGSDAERAAAFGPARARLNAKSATGEVKATPVAMLFAVLRIMRNVFAAKLGGKQRENRFFDASSGKPVVAPDVLTASEREKLGAN